jgi:hypothetical protein
MFYAPNYNIMKVLRKEGGKKVALTAWCMVFPGQLTLIHQVKISFLESEG